MGIFIIYRPADSNLDLENEPALDVGTGNPKFKVCSMHRNLVEPKTLGLQILCTVANQIVLKQNILHKILSLTELFLCPRRMICTGPSRGLFGYLGHRRSRAYGAPFSSQTASERQRISADPGGIRDSSRLCYPEHGCKTSVSSSISMNIHRIHSDLQYLAQSYLPWRIPL